MSQIRGHVLMDRISHFPDMMKIISYYLIKINNVSKKASFAVPNFIYENMLSFQKDKNIIEYKQTFRIQPIFRKDFSEQTV